MPSILTGKEYLALPSLSQPFLISPLLPVGGAMLLYGDPKIGKSYAALQLAVALVEGRADWLGFAVSAGTPAPFSGPWKVVYVQLDTPRSLWQERLKDLKASGEKIERIHFADRETLGTWPFDILKKEHFDILRSEIDRIGPDVVIIDTLKESHQLDENASTEQQKVISALVAATQPAALILVHHARKPSSDRPNDLIHGSRGSGYLTGRMDAIISFSKKSMHYVSRAIEEGSVRLDRLDNGFWEPAGAELELHIEALLSTPGSLREKAKELAARTGKTEEASRSLLRRRAMGRAGGGSSE